MGDVQERILRKLFCGGGTVTAITINGYQMHGNVVTYDDDVIVLDDCGKQRIVYKSALSTIVPDNPVRI